MQKSKKLAAAGIVLAGVCVLTFAVSSYQQKSEEIKESGETILSIASGDVTSLSWSYDADTLKSQTTSSSSSSSSYTASSGSESSISTNLEDVSGKQEFSFTKNNTWEYDEDANFPVSDEKIDDLLSVFENLGAAFEIDDVDDYSQYGLSDPVCTIKFGTDDNEYEIKIGDISKMDSQRYISIGDGRVYLAAADPMEKFACTLKNVIDSDTVPTFSTVSNIEFTGDEDYNIEYNSDSTESYNSSDVYYANTEDAVIPLDSSKVSSYLNTVSYMSLTDYVTYNASEDEIKKYGLDAPDLSISVDYKSTQDNTSGTFAISIARNPEQTDEITDDNVNDVKAYAMVDGSKIIYKISGTTYRSLMNASVDDLRHKELYTASTDDMTEITATVDGTDYTFTSKGSGDSKKWYYGEKEIDITKLTTALTALSASSFTTDTASDKEEISLTIKLDNDYKSEISITLYRYDGDNCLAYINNEPVAFVTRQLAVNLTEAVNSIVLSNS